MILKNGGKLIKEYPRIPGIDFSGTVEESIDGEFKKGDKVSIIESRPISKTKRFIVIEENKWFKFKQN